MNKPVLKIYALTLIMLVSACKQDAGNKVASTPGTASPDSTIAREDTLRSLPDSLKSTITYEIIYAPGGTFGYNILMDGKLMINQPNIPGMPGLKGFSKKEDAVKVAELVTGKLKNHEMPPTVMPDELKELGVVE